MDVNDVVFCGLIWAQFREPEAALTLLDAIESSDPELRSLAEAMLHQAGVCSMEVIQRALTGNRELPVELQLVAYTPGNISQASSSDFWWLPPASA